MRLITDAERPEDLWFAFRRVQVVLRQSPSALACSSRVIIPSLARASLISLILSNCRVFFILSGPYIDAHGQRGESRPPFGIHGRPQGSPTRDLASRFWPHL